MHQFTGGSDGSGPVAGVIFDSSGNLYGTTFRGGIGGSGIVFRLTQNQKGGWREVVLYPFQAGPSANPSASVVLDTLGNIYGSASDGEGADGTVFELTP